LKGRTDHVISIVVPTYNEAESLEQLYREIEETLESGDDRFEVVIVDDGSTDDTRAVLASMLEEHRETLRVVRLRRNFGRSAALTEGFRAARGERIVMMDADLQDVPSEVPKLLDELDRGYDVVSGWKLKRQDRLSKRLPSKFFNWTVNRISVAKVHDHGCGLKALRAEAARSLDLYGSLHRFIIPLLEANGYRATEVPVQHRRRQFGRSKIGHSRFLEGAFDLITVIFITRFRHRPLHFFGLIGLSCSGVGAALGVYLTLYKLIGHHQIGTRPLLFLSLLLIIVGVQIAATGIISEQLAALAGVATRSSESRLAVTPPARDLADRSE
jgi:glycosyltransferase involved in cell wall biosynthesis